jgi:SAM-dependent methyltransferase
MGVVHCSRVLAAVRATIAGLLSDRPRADAPVHLLDIGCWDGDATVEYAARLGGARMHGIEVFPGPADAARRRGVAVAALDLERDAWPYADGACDVLVCNQVLEHLKNIWLPLHEMARVTRTEGQLLLSVPNLASAHNRLLLLLGRQPTSIRIVGPHVRGYALRDFRALLERDGLWTVRRVVGVGFPPLPVGLAAPLARLWPGASHTPVLLCERSARPVGPLRRGDDAQTLYD